jgi:hypothetical protein
MEGRDGKIIPLPDEHDLHLSTLYHQTDAPPPSPVVEQRILAAARTAAEETLRRRRSPDRRRVPLPLASALLVLAGLAPLLLWHGYQGGLTRQPPVTAMPQPPLETAGDSELPLSPAAPPVPEPAQETSTEPAAASTPGRQELQVIEALIQAGRDAEAWERFGVFRRSFPEQRVPEALLDELAAVRARLLVAAEKP